MQYYSGTIRKMRVSTDSSNQVKYHLPVGEELLDVNALIGQTITAEYRGTIKCLNCERKTRKSFNQGYCYRCLITLAQCDSCIISPEKCHYDQGTCREPQWGEAHCLSDHFVYIANTGSLKVGITRHIGEGISSRWIDQGATQATVVMRVPDRLTSGLVETLCKSHIADKTNWRKMLTGEPEKQDLIHTKNTILEKISAPLQALQEEKGLQAIAEVKDVVHDIHYPVTTYPQKVKSINLDKTPQFSGALLGIKGQYWMLDGDRVINMRKYSGYEIEIAV
ncbi:DUF2797 domain-containing protein [Alteromonas pelagimontana]|uniref:DUF2797 domain-containing protein n=1 Tax=Alteromonas pelagimontana TaxID=1858656 RepID=A0A6M4MHE5_9ALTE|nr:DUF2797 domain-containing protein [Alteromonas pelagimontana]QJR82452.1 DUF2797 domain-containing protein [Alteromonas pelagimontana]